MFLSRFSTNIGIDLGTCNTIICINDKIVINEPSVVAVQKGTKKVVAVGADAKKCFPEFQPTLELFVLCEKVLLQTWILPRK